MVGSEGKWRRSRAGRAQLDRVLHRVSTPAQIRDVPRPHAACRVREITPRLFYASCGGIVATRMDIVSRALGSRSTFLPRASATCASPELLGRLSALATRGFRRRLGLRLRLRLRDGARQYRATSEREEKRCNEEQPSLVFAIHGVRPLPL